MRTIFPAIAPKLSLAYWFIELSPNGLRQRGTGKARFPETITMAGAPDGGNPDQDGDVFFQRIPPMSVALTLELSGRA